MNVFGSRFILRITARAQRGNEAGAFEEEREYVCHARAVRCGQVVFYRLGGGTIARRSGIHHRRRLIEQIGKPAQGPAHLRSEAEVIAVAQHLPKSESIVLGEACEPRRASSSSGLATAMRYAIASLI